MFHRWTNQQSGSRKMLRHWQSSKTSTLVNAYTVWSDKFFDYGRTYTSLQENKEPITAMHNSYIYSKNISNRYTGLAVPNYIVMDSDSKRYFVLKWKLEGSKGYPGLAYFGMSRTFTRYMRFNDNGIPLMSTLMNYYEAPTGIEIVAGINTNTAIRSIDSFPYFFNKNTEDKSVTNGNPTNIDRYFVTPYLFSGSMNERVRTSSVSEGAIIHKANKNGPYYVSSSNETPIQDFYISNTEKYFTEVPTWTGQLISNQQIWQNYNTYSVIQKDIIYPSYVIDCVSMDNVIKGEIVLECYKDVG